MLGLLCCVLLVGVGRFCCLCDLCGLLLCDVNSVVHVISFELVWINLLGLLGLMIVCCCFIYWLFGLGFGYRCERWRWVLGLFALVVLVFALGVLMVVLWVLSGGLVGCFFWFEAGCLVV